MEVRIFLLLFFYSQFNFAHQYLSYNDENYEIIIRNGKKGLIDDSGKILIPPIYDDLGWSNGEVTPVGNVIGYKQSSQWGLISISNKLVTPPSYVQLYNTVNGFIIGARLGHLSKTYFYGVLNAKGNAVIPFKYHLIEEIGELLIVAERIENKMSYGLLDFKNKEVLPVLYEKIYSISEELAIIQGIDGYLQIYHVRHRIFVQQGVTKLEEWGKGYFKIYKGLVCGLIDVTGDTIANVDYKDFRWDNDGLQGLKFSHWIVSSAENEIINEIDCDHIRFHGDKALLITPGIEQLVDKNCSPLTPSYVNPITKVIGYQVVFKEDGKYGLFDCKKQKVTRRNIDSLRLEGEFVYTSVMKGDKPVWAVYDTFEIKRNKFEYEVIRSHHKRLFAVKRKGHWGFIARNGQEVIACVYDSVGEFIDGKAVVKFHGQEGIINVRNKWVVIPRKAKIQYLKKGLFLSLQEGKTSLEKTNGELIYFTDNKLEYLNENLWEYRQDNSIVKIDLQGKVIETPVIDNSKYAAFKYENDEWVAVKLNGSYGFIDSKTGKLIITNRYEDVGHANGNLITVKILGKWGAINKNEQLIIQPVYDSIYDFKSGVAISTSNNLFGLVNEKGEEILSYRYQQIIRIENGRYLTKENGKYGLVDGKGKMIINNKYDLLQDLSNGYVIIRKGVKYGVLKLNGVNTIPQIYDKIIYNPQSDSYFAETKNKWETLIYE